LLVITAMAYFYVVTPEVFSDKLYCHCMIGCNHKLNMTWHGEELCECITGCNYDMSNKTTTTRINITGLLN
jgi:hypothetical protein